MTVLIVILPSQLVFHASAHYTDGRCGKYCRSRVLTFANLRRFGNFGQRPMIALTAQVVALLQPAFYCQDYEHHLNKVHCLGAPEAILIQARPKFGPSGFASCSTRSLSVGIWGIGFLAEQQAIREAQREIYHPAQT